MDDSKMYKALLKQQNRQRHEHDESRGTLAENTHLQNVLGQGTHKVEAPYRVERISKSRYRTGSDEPVIKYNPSISLDRIENPVPLSIAELRERKLVYPTMPNKAILNAYRELRIKLRDRSVNSNGLIMMSSLSRKVSSIHTAFNLAITFAMDSQTSALLVDCNPYEEDLAKLVSVPLAEGITDYVASPDMDVKQIIYPSGIDRLSVIPAGNLATSAVELFSSDRMKQLMSELKNRYPDRFLVMYAPPFTLSTEARILVRYADHTVFTVPFGDLSADDVLDSIDGVNQDTFAGLVYQE